MRCPSRRREMSSISQMERSSSQTRILATASPPGCAQCAGVVGRVSGGDRQAGIEAVQSQNEGSSLRRSGPCPNLAAVRLHNLIDNRQPEAGAALEVRLKGLKDFLDLLRAHARSRVGESDLPIFSQGFDRDGEHASAFHGADGILTEIPKYLLD